MNEVRDERARVTFARSGEALSNAPGMTPTASGRQKWFLRSAGLILVILGGAKIWSALGTAEILRVSDSMVGLQFRYFLLGVGCVELIIALACLIRPRESALFWLTCFSTALLVYRAGLFWIGWKGPCACMGNLTEALHLSPQAAENIVRVVLAYLLVGCYTLLACRAWQSRSRNTSPAARM
jgi:hypothetical protein